MKRGPLTQKEKEIIEKMRNAKSATEKIADKLDRTQKTVLKYIDSLEKEIPPKKKKTLYSQKNGATVMTEAEAFRADDTAAKARKKVTTKSYIHKIN